MSTDAGVTTLVMPCATSASPPIWECRPEKCGWWEVGGFTESIVPRDGLKGKSEDSVVSLCGKCVPREVF